MSRPVAHTLNSTSETAQFFKAYWPYMVGGTLIIGTIFYYYYQKNKKENDSNPT